jgi:hypothetical protein
LKLYASDKIAHLNNILFFWMGSHRIAQLLWTAADFCKYYKYLKKDINIVVKPINEHASKALLKIKKKIFSVFTESITNVSFFE